MDIRKYLQDRPLAFVVWTAAAAFFTYFSMYAFRKPLSAGTFEGLELWGISYKVILVVAQVLGYLFSKLIGIKVISELQPNRRFLMLIGLVGFSEIALILFALTPFPYGFIWVFFNGLPLGLIWGIVFSYLEGRRYTDILVTFLSVSFIVSSGIVKTAGRYLIENAGVNEFWMPALMGLLFFPLLWASAAMLDKAPLPSTTDQQLRTARVPLYKKDRKYLYKQFAFGLTAILLVNFVLTIGRDFKDNFLVEIWQNIGLDHSPFIYAKLEMMVGLLVLVLLAFLVLVKDNSKAFGILHWNMLGGLLLLLISTLLFETRMINAVWWMVLHGIGMYTAYISFQSLYFERFIATFQIRGTVGYLIYLSDFFGYLGSCLILILKELLAIQMDWTTFFIQLNYAIAGIGISCTLAAQIYFFVRKKHLIKDHA